MSFLDTAISLGAGYLAENKPEAKESWLSRVPLLGSLAEKLNPGQKEKAEKIRGHAEKERSGIFGEVWESILVRYFPGISKLIDVASSVGITDKDPETVPWQNEFEAFTAFSMFVPDFLLRYITDPFAESETFLKILEGWPMQGRELADKIRAKKDPDDVIDALRMMHQDLFATGKVSFESAFSSLFTK
ncbi:MAG: hypothetical protein WC304_03020 [Candidatus Gracilibacteria bacterium]|jgi:hypothetical protein